MSRHITNRAFVKAAEDIIEEMIRDAKTPKDFASLSCIHELFLNEPSLLMVHSNTWNSHYSYLFNNADRFDNSDTWLSILRTRVTFLRNRLIAELFKED